MTKTILVEHSIDVTVDESLFTDEFIEAFKKSLYPLDDIQEHIEHIALCMAKGVIHSDRDFLEGYGILRDFGVTIKKNYTDLI